MFRSGTLVSGCCRLEDCETVDRMFSLDEGMTGAVFVATTYALEAAPA